MGAFSMDQSIFHAVTIAAANAATISAAKVCMFKLPAVTISAAEESCVFSMDQ